MSIIVYHNTLVTISQEFSGEHHSPSYLCTFPALNTEGFANIIKRQHAGLRCVGRWQKHIQQQYANRKILVDMLTRISHAYT